MPTANYNRLALLLLALLCFEERGWGNHQPTYEVPPDQSSDSETAGAKAYYEDQIRGLSNMSPEDRADALKLIEPALMALGSEADSLIKQLEAWKLAANIEEETKAKPDSKKIEELSTQLKEVEGLPDKVVEDLTKRLEVQKQVLEIQKRLKENPDETTLREYQKILPDLKPYLSPKAHQELSDGVRNAFATLSSTEGSVGTTLLGPNGKNQTYLKDVPKRDFFDSVYPLSSFFEPKTPPSAPQAPVHGPELPPANDPYSRITDSFENSRQKPSALDSFSSLVLNPTSSQPSAGSRSSSGTNSSHAATSDTETSAPSSGEGDSTGSPSLSSPTRQTPRTSSGSNNTNNLPSQGSDHGDAGIGSTRIGSDRASGTPTPNINPPESTPTIQIPKRGPSLAAGSFSPNITPPSPATVTREGSTPATPPIQDLPPGNSGNSRNLASLASADAVGRPVATPNTPQTLPIPQSTTQTTPQPTAGNGKPVTNFSPTETQATGPKFEKPTEGENTSTIKSNQPVTPPGTIATTEAAPKSSGVIPFSPDTKANKETTKIKTSDDANKPTTTEVGTFTGQTNATPKGPLELGLARNGRKSDVSDFAAQVAAAQKSNGASAGPSPSVVEAGLAPGQDVSSKDNTKPAPQNRTPAGASTVNKKLAQQSPSRGLLGTAEKIATQISAGISAGIRGLRALFFK